MVERRTLRCLVKLGALGDHEAAGYQVTNLDRTSAGQILAGLVCPGASSRLGQGVGWEVEGADKRAQGAVSDTTGTHWELIGSQVLHKLAFPDGKKK